ncbi:MAG: HD domain-containing protein [Faecalimonas sp.]|nr:HD domain-containing protein [Faecalimonas sp.]
MDDKRLSKQFEFCLEADKEKFIGRQTYLSDGIRKENDAEHAWHMAVMTLILGEYANEKIDLLKTISMILIHDIVEIDAGDTYAYDEEKKKSQKSRELAAADRIFAILPEDQQQKFRQLWNEFEAAETPEAKFARAMDNVQPIMLNNATDGKSWKERSVRLSQILKRNQITPDGSQKLWDYMRENFIKPNVDSGKIIKDI